jgi:hypothetical protein
MMKRAAWFVSGAAAGIGATRFAKRKAQQMAEKITPDHIARQTVASVKDKAVHVADALRDGRDTMRSREAELRARRDGHAVTKDQPVRYGPVIDAQPTEGVHRLDDWRKRRRSS